MKKASLAAAVAFGIIGTFLGVLLLIVPVDLLLRIFFVAFGALTLVSGIPQLIFSIANIGSKPKEAAFDMILAIVTIMAGLVLLFIQSAIVMIFVGAYLIVFPLIRVVLASEKFLQFKKELPAVILGVVMLIVGPADVMDKLFDIAGVVFIALSLIYMAVEIVASIKRPKKSGNPVIYVEARDLSEGSEENDNK